MSSADAVVAAVEEILAQGGEADDALRQVVAAIQASGYVWAGLFFVEEGSLTLGPEAGTPDEDRRLRVPVLWQGHEVAELAVDGASAEDAESFARVADLVSGQCLVGWDTGGEPWES